MTGDKFTIRTSAGELYGSFDSRDDAWSAIGRIRETNYWESVENAAVVPLLAGVTPMPIDPAFLRDGDAAAGEPQEGLTQRELDAAVDTFVGAYNSSRSAFLGYSYASAYLVASGRDLRAAVSAVLAPVLAEVDRLTAERHPVLGEIRAERARQDERWGEQNHPDGTDGGLFFAERRDYHRRVCQEYAAVGGLTWRHILDEEVHEAYAETDPAKLRRELVQVCAVAVAWIEAIDRRGATFVEVLQPREVEQP